MPSFTLSAQPRLLLIALAAFSAFMLGFALMGQFGFNWHPCELCILQRYPYVAIIVIGIAGAFLRNSKWQRYLLVACVLLLLADASIAAYHAGVEQGIFKGPDACSNDAPAGQSIEDMRKAILNAPLVTCKQAMVYIFGLSLAAWNALAALGALVFTLYCMRKPA